MKNITVYFNIFRLTKKFYQSIYINNWIKNPMNIRKTDRLKRIFMAKVLLLKTWKYPIFIREILKDEEKTSTSTLSLMKAYIETK